MVEQPAIEIELHDARISRISILNEGNIEIEFAHLCSYHGNPDDGGEVWSSSAVIVLSQVRRLEVDGIINAKDYVTEGQICDEQGDEVSLLPLGDWKPASSMSLLLAGSGARIDVSMASIALTKFARVRKLENWIT